MAEVAEITIRNQIRVYPNPAVDLFTVELTDTGTSGLRRIEIYNTNGLIISTEQLHAERKYQCSFHLKSVFPGKTGMCPVFS
jgi:hypothetical protein